VLRVRRLCVGAGELDDDGADCGEELGGGIIITACRRFEPVTGGGTFSRKGKETLGTWMSVGGTGGTNKVDWLGFICGSVRAGLRGIEDRGGEEDPAVTRDGGGDGDGLCDGAVGRCGPLALGAEEWLPLSRSSSSSSSSSLHRTASNLASTQSMTLPMVIPAS